MTVFADTSALYAVLDADDEFHGRAADARQRLLSDDAAFTFDADFRAQGFEPIPG